MVPPCEVDKSAFDTGALTLDQGTPNVGRASHSRMRKDLFVYGPEHQRARAHFLVEQAGRCAICGTNERMLVVDHEHSEMGLVRGLLCDQCNQGLGCLGDTLERLELAVAYLRRHVPRNEAYGVSDQWRERQERLPADGGELQRSPYHRRLRDRQIVAAARAGFTPEAIAAQFDVSLSTVYRVAREDAA
jgi:hypothetical protein